jgi:hypothetical protein
MGRSALADGMLNLYFFGMIASGVVGLMLPGGVTTLVQEVTSNSLTAVLYDASLIMVGAAGAAATVARSRMGEFYAIIGISVLTILNALIIMTTSPQTAVRLAFAPLMMIPYGWMRLGFNVSRADVKHIREAIGEGEKDEP